MLVHHVIAALPVTVGLHGIATEAATISWLAELDQVICIT